MVSQLAPFVLLFAAVVLLAMAPLLAAERFRALLSWPTDRLTLNYPLVGVGLIAVQIAAYLVVIVLVNESGAIDGGEAGLILVGIALSNVLVPAAGAAGAVGVLPRRGTWTPHGDGLDGRIVLAAGVLWYALVATVTVFLVALAFMFANLPL
ncbi:hypothetical protein [Halomicrobium urmianum]|uniref:hypothetical protein n=1 Tax=Halomicrobium urmianum TaxID=1586233 RepID=UPI001CD91CDD|nr:hypothetical protein [Halomicrobium urmianum]